METLLTALAILIWMGLGALVAVAAMAVARSGKGPVLTQEDFEMAMTETLEQYGQLVDKRIREKYAPFSERLDKACWLDDGATRVKHRVVAVSHRGAVNVRPWSAKKGAFWIPADKVADRVRWEEACDEEGV